MKIALYFGSFNPIHKGHIAIMEYILSENLCDEVWLVVSPQNPLKEISTLANETDRLEMAKLGLSNSDYENKIIVSDIEFELQKPSYTINTLVYLKKQFPLNEFSIIMGEDNLDIINKWKNWQEIINNHKLLVYPRTNGANIPHIQHSNINIMTEAPRHQINSTQIRDAIKKEINIDELTTKEVVEYIKINKLYL